MDNLYIRSIQLPIKVKAVTVKDSNDDYNIYINALLSEAEQLFALSHEMIHVRRDDFYSECSVRVIESEVREEMVKYESGNIRTIFD